MCVSTVPWAMLSKCQQRAGNKPQDTQSALAAGQSVGLTHTLVLGLSVPAEELLQVEASVQVSFHAFENSFYQKKNQNL